MKDRDIKEIVVTGGPCGGKTTFLNYVTEWLENIGYKVFIVPEVATRFISNGLKDIAKIKKEYPEKYIDIEKIILLEQLHQRRNMLAFARMFPGRKTVIIYDRGPMDVMAYVNPGVFKEIIDKEHLSWYDIRDCFDGVVLLVTAAKGAEKYYTLANNVARLETDLAEARLADDETVNAWVGCNRLRVIDNSTNFDEKMKRAFGAVCRFVGIPVPLKIERKFLLETNKDFQEIILKTLNAQAVKIEQVYLTAPVNHQIRVRRRVQDESFVCYLTDHVVVSPTSQPETEIVIGRTEYDFLKETSRLRNSATIVKNRWCFVWENQYFKLDEINREEFMETEPPIYVLEVALTEENDTVSLPSFLKVQREITCVQEYSNWGISLGKHMEK